VPSCGSVCAKSTSNVRCAVTAACSRPQPFTVVTVPFALGTTRRGRQALRDVDGESTLFTSVYFEKKVPATTTAAMSAAASPTTTKMDMSSPGTKRGMLPPVADNGPNTPRVGWPPAGRTRHCATLAAEASVHHETASHVRKGVDHDEGGSRERRGGEGRPSTGAVPCAPSSSPLGLVVAGAQGRALTYTSALRSRTRQSSSRAPCGTERRLSSRTRRICTGRRQCRH
jgi:hypothetical protein